VGKLDGKVAFITGAARGQGRSHAVRLAEEGADIIAVDICAQIDTVPYPLADAADLAETVEQVKRTGRRIFAGRADVRDAEAIEATFQAGMDELGPADIVVANAGIASIGADSNRQGWQDVVDVNLTGVFNTVEAAVPSMVDRGQGGAIVLISSTAGITGLGSMSPGGIGYTASKHGVVGLMRNYATNLARHSIRVNSVHPTGVNTTMIRNDAMRGFLAAADHQLGLANALPVEALEPSDITNAVVWLVSDEARYVTGVLLPIDAGFQLK
jgi:SDR family mycofactocin-dependent oxidoreductase